MHGHHGWGGHWGHHWGGGWGFGWFFPALIVGKLISEAFDRPQAQGWPYPPQAIQPPPPPQPQSQPRPSTAFAPEPKASIRCQNCEQLVSGDFTFCPNCGRRVSPMTCRY